MKAQITIGIAVVFAVIVGGLSMGCLDAPDIPAAPEIPDVVDIPTVPPEVITVVEVIVVEVTEVTEVEVITYKEYPVIVYCECTVEYPDNVAGFDTPKERAYIYQGMLNDKMDSLYADGIAQQRYQQWGDKSYTDFYHTFYQDKLDKYTKLYCGLGNRILTDTNDPIVRDVGAFNFTSPWGPRNLGNGSFIYDTYQGTVSFVGEEIASGGAVTVNASGATIGNMYYTYMGNNATLPGETNVTF
jgi:hypothetical protein